MISPLLVLESHSRGRVGTGREDRERARDENLLALCELGSAKRVLLPSIRCNHSILRQTSLLAELTTCAQATALVLSVNGEFYAIERLHEEHFVIVHLTTDDADKKSGF
jgi:hypothetical protein